MDNMSAFYCGLLLGSDDGVASGFGGRVGRIEEKRDTDVALQDVVFCQSLRNLLDEADRFARRERPTPRRFIEHIAGEEPRFAEPLSDSENWSDGNVPSGNADIFVSAPVTLTKGASFAATFSRV